MARHFPLYETDADPEPRDAAIAAVSYGVARAERGDCDGALIGYYNAARHEGRYAAAGGFSDRVDRAIVGLQTLIRRRCMRATGKAFRRSRNSQRKRRQHQASGR